MLPLPASNALTRADYTYVSHELDEPGTYAVKAVDDMDGELVTVYVTETGTILSVDPEPTATIGEWLEHTAPLKEKPEHA